MYIHSTDSSCEKTKQEKQKKLFNSLTEKTEKNPEKTKTARWKKLPHSPLKWKKKMKIWFWHYVPPIFTCLLSFLSCFTTHYYYHLLLWKQTKTLVNYYVFLSFFFSSFRNFSYVLGKIAGKCWQWKETKSFPFLNSPLPMFHVNCEWWCWMDEIKFFFDT